MDRFDIARAMQGFSEGVAGRGQQYLQQLDQNRKAAMAEDALRVEQLLESGDVSSTINLLSNRAENINRLGGDPSDTMGLMNKIQSGDIQGALSDAKAVTIGARNAGFLPQLQRKIVDGQLVEIDPSTGRVTAKSIEGLTPKDTGTSVQSSEILPDGVTVQVMKDGSTQVTSSDGEKLTGKSRAKAIKDARKFGAEVQGMRATERTLGTDPIKTSIKLGEQAFQKIDGVRKNIGNLDKVISAIDKGAGTGAFERFFPSIRAASVELDNLRNRLGLDVIGDVTFGALSEGELNLALDTALPTGLNEPELKQWALDKKKAQESYARELERAAGFFSRGGNIADYIAIRRNETPQSTTVGNQQNQDQSAPVSGFKILRVR